MGALPSRESHESASFFRFARSGPYAIATIPLTEAYFPDEDCLAFRQVWKCREEHSSKYTLDHLEAMEDAAGTSPRRACTREGSGEHGEEVACSAPSSSEPNSCSEDNGGDSHRSTSQHVQKRGQPHHRSFQTSSSAVDGVRHDDEKDMSAATLMPFLIHSPEYSLDVYASLPDDLAATEGEWVRGCRAELPATQQEVHAALEAVHASNGLLVGVSAVTKDNYNFFFDRDGREERSGTAVLPHELLIDPASVAPAKSVADPSPASTRSGSAHKAQPYTPDEAIALARRALYDMIIAKKGMLVDTNKEMCDVYAEEVRWRHARHTLREHRRQQRARAEAEASSTWLPNAVEVALTEQEITALETVPPPRRFLHALSEALIVRMTVEEEHSARLAYYEAHPEARPEGFPDTYHPATGSGGHASGSVSGAGSGTSTGTRQQYCFENNLAYKDGRIHLVEEDGVLYLFAYNTAPCARQKGSATSTTAMKDAHASAPDADGQVVAMQREERDTDEGDTYGEMRPKGDAHGRAVAQDRPHPHDEEGGEAQLMGSGVMTRQQSMYTAESSFGGDDYEACIRQYDEQRRQRRLDRRNQRLARQQQQQGSGGDLGTLFEDGDDEDDEDEDSDAGADDAVVAQLLLETHNTFVLPICPVRVVAVCGFRPTTFCGSPWLHGLEDDPEEIVYREGHNVKPPVMHSFMIVDAAMGEKFVSRATTMRMQTFTLNCHEAGLPEAIVRPLVAADGLLDLSGIQLMRELRFRVRAGAAAAAAEVEQGDDWLRRLIQGTEYDMDEYIGAPNECQAMEPHAAVFDDESEHGGSDQRARDKDDGEERAGSSDEGRGSRTCRHSAHVSGPATPIDAPLRADKTGGDAGSGEGHLERIGATQAFAGAHDSDNGEATVGGRLGQPHTTRTTDDQHDVGNHVEGDDARAKSEEERSALPQSPTASGSPSSDASSSARRARNTALLRAFRKGLLYPRHASEISVMTSVRGGKSFWQAQADAQRHALDLFSNAIIPFNVAPYMKPITTASYDYGGTVNLHMVYPLHTAAALIKKTGPLSSIQLAQEDAQVLPPPRHVRHLVAEELERDMYRRVYGGDASEEPEGAIFTVPNANSPPLRKVYVVTDLSHNERGPSVQHHLWKMRYSQYIAKRDQDPDGVLKIKNDWQSRVEAAITTYTAAFQERTGDAEEEEKEACDADAEAGEANDGPRASVTQHDTTEPAEIKNPRAHEEKKRKKKRPGQGGSGGASTTLISIPPSSPLTIPVEHQYMYPPTCFVEGDLVCYNVRRGRWEHFDPIFQHEQRERQRQRHQRTHQRHVPSMRAASSATTTVAHGEVNEGSVEDAKETCEDREKMSLDVAQSARSEVRGSAPVKRVSSFFEAEYPDDAVDDDDNDRGYKVIAKNRDDADPVNATPRPADAASVAANADPVPEIAEEVALEDILLPWVKRQLQGVSLRGRHDPGWLRSRRNGRIVQQGRYCIWHFRHDGQAYYYGVVPKFARDGEKRKLCRRRQLSRAADSGSQVSSNAGFSDASRDLTGGEDDEAASDYVGSVQSSHESFSARVAMTAHRQTHNAQPLGIAHGEADALLVGMEADGNTDVTTSHGDANSNGATPTTTEDAEEAALGSHITSVTKPTPATTETLPARAAERKDMSRKSTARGARTTANADIPTGDGTIVEMTSGVVEVTPSLMNGDPSNNARRGGRDGRVSGTRGRGATRTAPLSAKSSHPGAGTSAAAVVSTEQLGSSSSNYTSPVNIARVQQPHQHHRQWPHQPMTTISAGRGLGVPLPPGGAGVGYTPPPPFMNGIPPPPPPMSPHMPDSVSPQGGIKTAHGSCHSGAERLAGGERGVCSPYERAAFNAQGGPSSVSPYGDRPQAFQRSPSQKTRHQNPNMNALSAPQSYQYSLPQNAGPPQTQAHPQQQQWSAYVVGDRRGRENAPPPSTPHSVPHASDFAPSPSPPPMSIPMRPSSSGSSYPSVATVQMPNAVTSLGVSQSSHATVASSYGEGSMYSDGGGVMQTRRHDGMSGAGSTWQASFSMNAANTTTSMTRPMSTTHRTSLESSAVGASGTGTRHVSVVRHNYRGAAPSFTNMSYASTQSVAIAAAAPRGSPLPQQQQQQQQLAPLAGVTVQTNRPTSSPLPPNSMSMRVAQTVRSHGRTGGDVMIDHTTSTPPSSVSGSLHVLPDGENNGSNSATSPVYPRVASANGTWGQRNTGAGPTHSSAGIAMSISSGHYSTPALTPASREVSGREGSGLTQSHLQKPAFSSSSSAFSAPTHGSGAVRQANRYAPTSVYAQAPVTTTMATAPAVPDQVSSRGRQANAYADGTNRDGCFQPGAGCATAWASQPHAALAHSTLSHVHHQRQQQMQAQQYQPQPQSQPGPIQQPITSPASAIPDVDARLPVSRSQINGSFVTPLASPVPFQVPVSHAQGGAHRHCDNTDSHGVATLSPHAGGFAGRDGGGARRAARRVAPQPSPSSPSVHADLANTPVDGSQTYHQSLQTMAPLVPSAFGAGNDPQQKVQTQRPAPHPNGATASRQAEFNACGSTDSVGGQRHVYANATQEFAAPQWEPQQALSCPPRQSLQHPHASPRAPLSARPYATTHVAHGNATPCATPSASPQYTPSHQHHLPQQSQQQPMASTSSASQAALAPPTVRRSHDDGPRSNPHRRFAWNPYKTTNE